MDQYSPRAHCALSTTRRLMVHAFPALNCVRILGSLRYHEVTTIVNSKVFSIACEEATHHKITRISLLVLCVFCFHSFGFSIFYLLLFLFSLTGLFFDPVSSPDFISCTFFLPLHLLPYFWKLFYSLSLLHFLPLIFLTFLLLNRPPFCSFLLLLFHVCLSLLLELPLPFPSLTPIFSFFFLSVLRLFPQCSCHFSDSPPSSVVVCYSCLKVFLALPNYLAQFHLFNNCLTTEMCLTLSN
jgi:hypothetical protein